MIINDELTAFIHNYLEGQLGDLEEGETLEDNADYNKDWFMGHWGELEASTGVSQLLNSMNANQLSTAYEEACNSL